MIKDRSAAGSRGRSSRAYGEDPAAPAPVVARSRVPGGARRALDRLRTIWAKPGERGQLSQRITRTGAYVLTLEGELHSWNAEEVADRIREALRASEVELVVDLSKVRSLDCSVLTDLIVGLRDAQGQGSGFVLVRPNPFIWRVFEVTGVSDEFPSFGSLQAALESLPAQPDVVAHDLRGERLRGQFTARQERVLAALYWTRAFDAHRRQPVHALVKNGYLSDSRYAGPLAALADRGLVDNQHEILGRNWSGSTAWWLTEDGRQVAKKLL